MNYIYHLFDNSSRESQALSRYTLETGRRLKLFRSLSEIPIEDIESEVMISGSVEIVQEALGYSVKPDYFPEFTRDFIGRSVKYSNDIKCTYGRSSFIKPSDSYKRFDGFIYDPTKTYLDFLEGPYEIQSLVDINKEGRYYITMGKIVCDGWYSPNPEAVESNSPIFPKDMIIPEDWSGTIDVAELNSGEVIVLECHHPFACGWYGESKDFMKYGEWIENGFCYMKNLGKVLNPSGAHPTHLT